MTCETHSVADTSTVPSDSPFDVAIGLVRAAAADQARASAHSVAVQAELLAALKGMVSIYDGLRDVLTSPTIIAKLAAADAAIAKAEAR